jgi:hypothetical protein
MELVVGPFDPSIHVRSRDHYEAIRREAQFLELQPEAPPRRYEELGERLMVQFGRAQVDPVVDRAYLAREPSFVVRIEIPDEQVGELFDVCGELIRVSEELDRWAQESGGEILEASPEIRAYRAAFLAQLRDQLEAGGAKHPQRSR